MIPERKTKYPADSTSGVLEPQPANFRKKKTSWNLLSKFVKISQGGVSNHREMKKCGSVFLKGYLMGEKQTKLFKGLFLLGRNYSMKLNVL